VLRVARELHERGVASREPDGRSRAGGGGRAAPARPEGSASRRLIGSDRAYAMTELRRLLGCSGSKDHEDPERLGYFPSLPARGDELMDATRARRVSAVTHETSGPQVPLLRAVDLTAYRNPQRP